MAGGSRHPLGAGPSATGYGNEAVAVWRATAAGVILTTGVAPQLGRVPPPPNFCPFSANQSLSLVASVGTASDGKSNGRQSTTAHGRETTVFEMSLGSRSAHRGLAIPVV